MRCTCAATRSGTGSPATSTRPCARSKASISVCGRPPRNGRRSLIVAYSVLDRAFCGEGSVPGGALGGGADAVPEIGVEAGRPPVPMRRDLLFDLVGLLRRMHAVPPYSHRKTFKKNYRGSMLLCCSLSAPLWSMAGRRG